MSSRDDVRRARIRFTTPDEGGRSTPPATGVRSQIELGEFQTSCIVSSTSGLAELPLGEEIDVEIRVLFPDEAGERFGRLVDFELHEGCKLVARGSFTDSVDG